MEAAKEEAPEGDGGKHAKRGDRTKIDSSLLRDKAAALLMGLGLPRRTPDDHDTLDVALELAIPRLEKRTHSRYSGAAWEDVIVLRELVKVLAGGIFKEKVRGALGSLGKSGDVMTKAVFDLLSPEGDPGKGPEAGRFFDPSRWDLALAPAGGEPEVFARLSLLASAMLVQEESTGDAGMTVREVAERITRPSSRKRRWGA